MSASRTPSSRRVPLPSGITLHALEWNAASAARHTVFLVHGFLDLSWGWQRMVEHWLERHPQAAESLHIVAPDMRGHGDSDRVGAGGYYHFFDYLGDMHGLVSALRRDRVSLVGHSMGGSICGYYAGAFADGVHRLALLEGLAPPEEPLNMPLQVRTWLASWQRARERKSTGCVDVAAAADRLMRHDSLLTRDLALELAEHSTRDNGAGRLVFKHDPVHLTRGPYPFRLDQAASLWAGVRCPVLYVSGSESTFAARQQDIQKRLAHFQVPVEAAQLMGAGHMMQRHKPAELADVLDAFVRAPEQT